MKKWKVLATAVTFGKINKQPLERLEENGCKVITNPFGRPFTEGEFIKYGHDADAIIVGNDKVTADIIEKCTNLKVIAKHGVGVDAIDIQTANEYGIVVTYAPGSNAEEVADLTFGLMINLARGIISGNEDTKAGRWTKPMGRSFYKKTIGILGLGSIGLACARRGKGFGMNILGYDIIQNLKAMELGVQYVSLKDLLQKSDYITLHLPLTDQTKNILNKENLSLVKKDVVIVNTARSQLVDYNALYERLTNGTVRGYATDVYDLEPPKHLPLFDLSNVILTPHIGGTTVESNRRMGETAVDNVLAVLKGEQVPNEVRARAFTKA
ncbi:phosphoglycerate dehydrogenase [Garciella nitratireducens]|uniref:phosphoglycerate dehydrogenase n=1 Tax=Garciella nitratireducens TaxID=218205 RepID=UPI001BD3EBBA|nr:phosphoglycerate dehydrogenase [Garciella nitratireducens]